MKHFYSFCPAAIFPKTDSGLGIYVKYHSTRDIIPHVKLYTPRYVWIDTPDRELIISNDSVYEDSNRPLGLGFDSFTSLSIFHTHGVDLGVDWGMVNYVSNMNPGWDVEFSKTYAHYNKKRCLIMSDSGGLQLSRGIMNFINPEHLAVWSHNNVDAVMSLDLPMFNLNDDWSFAKRVARMQRDNNIRMLEVFKRLDSHTQLINIFHGKNIEVMHKYHDIIYDRRITKMAIGGLPSQSIFDSTRLILDVMTSDMATNYDHVHLLGVFNAKVLPIYIWIFKRLNEKRDIKLTTDSTTALQNAMSRTSMNYWSYDKPIQFNNLGLTGYTGHNESRKIPSSFRTLNCACPACSVIKYSDIFTYMIGSNITKVLSYHNYWNMCKYGHYMTTVSQELSFADYCNLVSRQVLDNNRETVDVLKYAQMYLDKGKERADRHYSHYLNRLFSPPPNVGLFGQDDYALDVDNTSSLRSNLIKVLERYESYHKKGTIFVAKLAGGVAEMKRGGRSSSASKNYKIKLRRKK